MVNPCLAKHGYKDGGRLPVIDITRDCYDVFPIKVQYKEVGGAIPLWTLLPTLCV
eukprot:COSAG02_NODE_633_length_19262_cov_32.473256_13_plen_55_part_00